MDARRIFVLVARAEGVSTLLLFFFAVPLKYGAGVAHATQGPGMLHGLLFVAYVGCLAWVATVEGWGLRRSAVGLLASFFPFGTFWFETQLGVAEA